MEPAQSVLSRGRQGAVASVGAVGTIFPPRTNLIKEAHLPLASAQVSELRHALVARPLTPLLVALGARIGAAAAQSCDRRPQELYRALVLRRNLLGCRPVEDLAKAAVDQREC